MKQDNNTIQLNQEVPEENRIPRSLVATNMTYSCHMVKGKSQSTQIARREVKHHLLPILPSEK